MTRPSSGYPTSATVYTGLITIDSILGNNKWWQSSSKEAVTLSYSFPWTTSDVASFLGPDGSTSTYSKWGELDAEFYFGLNEVEQNAFKDILIKWSSVANITFSEINERVLAKALFINKSSFLKDLLNNGIESFSSNIKFL